MTAKLALTTAGTVLALVVLTPTLSGLTAASRSGDAITLGDRLELVRDSGAACLVLLVTVVLSVYKPFGRIRKSSVTARAT